MEAMKRFSRRVKYRRRRGHGIRRGVRTEEYGQHREREGSEFLEIDIGRQSVRGMRGINRIKRKVSFFFSFSDVRNWMEYKENEASL